MFDFLKSNKVITPEQATAIKAQVVKLEAVSKKNPKVLIGAIIGFKLAGLTGAIAGAGAGFMMKSKEVA